MSNPLGSTQGYVASQAESARVAGFLQKVYGWMFAGLAITAAVAWLVAGSPAVVQTLAANRLLFWVVLLAPLGFVWYLSAKVDTIAPNTAALVFSTYAALNGVTFAFVLLAYTGASIASTFLTAAAMFGALAVYGSITKRSLAGIGQFAFMGLIGVIIASIIGIFWQNNMFQFVLSVCGVLVFTALTAWDAQKLRSMALAMPEGRAGSYAVVGALALYLDFINLFLFLLRLFGQRRD
ncbi:MAG TPA: Bax inhibitor-1/YccA family protein [Gemmatimonadales bacterium]|nr:Bax inhibitor-1/YccA family protein [Gemmatimonadales bacterium]